MNSITLLDAQDQVLEQAGSYEAVSMTVEHVYEPGDHLVITADEKHIYLSVDAFLTPGYVYVPEGKVSYLFPTTDFELKPYAPQAFRGNLHTYFLAGAPQAAAAYRNLALNPLSQRQFCGGYPFARANVETRDEPVFFARNVIDGCTQNHSHGSWPFQSWGIGLSETAECTIEFGREVEVDRMLLTLRADFPHDAYWKQASVTMSDGTEMTFPLEKSDGAQEVKFGAFKRICWIKLHHLVKEVMDSPFPALTEWEVWGRGSAILGVEIEAFM